MPSKDPAQPPHTRWRARLHEIIFEAETPAGRAFDVALIISIITSIVVVLLESVVSVRARHGTLLRSLEWGFTIAFTVEYLLRLLSVRRPLRYASSFFGIVDLAAIVPTYASLFVAGAQSLIVIRALRLLRIFRVFKLSRYVGEAHMLRTALKASARKITVFLGTVLTIVLVVGTAMYVLEGEANGFTSIPRSMYWAIVTLTTVGYGDLAPKTPLGQLLASALMVLGYGIIAVPTGIVTVELAQAHRPVSTEACPACSVQGHDVDARFCRRCGAALHPGA